VSRDSLANPGECVDRAVSRDSLANPVALEPFVELASRSAGV